MAVDPFLEPANLPQIISENYPQFRHIMLTPMTAREFLDALKAESRFIPVYYIYNELLKINLRKRRLSPVDAERLAMRDLKRTWVNTQPTEIQEMLKEDYRRSMKGRFIVNLSQVYPGANLTPFDRIKCGVAMRDLPSLLRQVYTEDLARTIFRDIVTLGGSGKIYVIEDIAMPDGARAFRTTVYMGNPGDEKIPVIEPPSKADIEAELSEEYVEEESPGEEV